MISYPQIANGVHQRRLAEEMISEADAGFVAAVSTRWARRAHDAASNVVDYDPEMAALIYSAAHKRVKSIIRQEVGADTDAAGLAAALQLCSAVFHRCIFLAGGRR